MGGIFSQNLLLPIETIDNLIRVVTSMIFFTILLQQIKGNKFLSVLI